MDVAKTLKNFVVGENKGIMQLILLAVALLIIFVVIQILPMVNGNIASSITLPANGSGSEWNASVNTDLVTASDMWASTGGIFKVTLIVAIIAVLLAYLFSVVPKQAGQGGL